jgi:hypothetical protein
MHDYVAECERCGGFWRVRSRTRLEHQQGNCPGCRDNDDDDSVERPLTFRPPTVPEEVFMDVMPSVPPEFLYDA